MPVKQVFASLQKEEETLKRYEIEQPSLYKSNSFIPKQQLPIHSKAHEQTVWDNYGSPFRLKISRRQIEVYMLTRTPETFFSKFGDYYFPNEPLFVLDDFEGAWYGYDPTDIDDPHPIADSHSNTLLIQLNEKEYIWVGAMIKKITIPKNQKMKDFITDLGNNGVPESYLITSKRIIDLFSSQCIDLPNQKIKLHKLSMYMYKNHDQLKETKMIETIIERM